MKGLSIVASGLVTAIGFNAAASLAALRAGISGIRETHLADRHSGDALHGAKADLPHWWEGLDKVADLAALGLSYDSKSDIWWLKKAALIMRLFPAGLLRSSMPTSVPAQGEATRIQQDVAKLRTGHGPVPQLSVPLTVAVPVKVHLDAPILVVVDFHAGWPNYHGCIRAVRARHYVFVREAHILARFRHPVLVSVLRFFSANGTAYMVMPYYRGKTLHYPST